MIHVRTMTADDVPLGMRLKEQAGWNQTEVDWQRFLDMQPDGCFVAELAGQPVGTAAACVFDSVGWVSMVLVDAAVRRRGIGTRLVEHCVAYLDRRGVQTMRLDATPLGKPIYQRLGFSTEYELARWEGVASAGALDSRLAPVTAQWFDAVSELDRQATGTNRRRLIEHFYRERPGAMFAYAVGQQLAGYLAFRAGSQAAQIGPAVALSQDAGWALGDAALWHCAAAPVFVDVPTGNGPAMRWAESRGLTVQRHLARMWRGKPIHDQPQQLWASSGPAYG